MTAANEAVSGVIGNVKPGCDPNTLPSYLTDIGCDEGPVPGMREDGSPGLVFATDSGETLKLRTIGQ